MSYVDSVGKPFQPETNLYQYTGNNPVNFIDPFGLDYIENGIIYNDAGSIIGELPLEAPNPLLDPINYIGGLGGGAKSFLQIEINVCSKGNVLKIISKKLRRGFRIDPAHHGKRWGHPHYWEW